MNGIYQWPAACCCTYVCCFCLLEEEHCRGNHTASELHLCQQVYKAEQPGRSLRVYHLFYEDSQESDKFTAAVSREVTVFQDLIRQKEFMVLPDPIQALDQVCICLTSSSHKSLQGRLPPFYSVLNSSLPTPPGWLHMSR